MNKTSNYNSLKSLRNICLNSDIIDTLESFKKKNIKFNMIYSDPDYNVDISYSGIKYTRKWDEYMDWYGRLTKLSLECLKDDGHLFLLNYPKQNSHLRVKYLDEENDNVPDFSNSFNLLKKGKISEYVWIYNSNIGVSKGSFTTAHRTILHIVKNKKTELKDGNWWMPYKNPNPLFNRMVKKMENDGISNDVARVLASDYITNTGRKPYSWISEEELENSNLKTPGGGSMYYDLVKNYSPNKTIHPCQIPTKLVNGLIQSSTNEKDHVFIHFGGSGSELLMCRDINRYFTSCEISPKYHKMILDRLKNEKNGKLDDKYKLLKTKIGKSTK